MAKKDVEQKPIGRPRLGGEEGVETINVQVPKYLMRRVRAASARGTLSGWIRYALEQQAAREGF